MRRPWCATSSATRCENVGPALLVLLTLITSAGCAPGRVVLPDGTGEPFYDYSSVFAEVTRECRGVRTLEAVLSLAGRADGRRLQGKVLVGLATPASLRLVGIAPFGPPTFILVARPPDSTLLLLRDRRVVKHEPVSEILQALTGVALEPDDLRSVLSGCVVSNSEPIGGRAYGDEWLVIDLRGGAIAYLRVVNGERRIVGGVRGAVSLEYSHFVRQIPRRVRFMASYPDDVTVSQDTDFTVTMSQIQINVPFGPDVFTLKIPIDALPMTLEELQRAKPLTSE